MDQGVNVEFLEKEENLGLMVCQEPKVSQEHLVQMARRAVQGLRVMWVI